MDDGRETSVQTDMFLILTCDSFEHYLLNIHQSILHIISKNLQSFSEEINSFKRFLYPFQDTEQKNSSSLFLRIKDCISFKRRCSLMIKRDECV